MYISELRYQRSPLETEQFKLVIESTNYNEIHAMMKTVDFQ